MIAASARVSMRGAQALAERPFTRRRRAAPDAIGMDQITFVSWNVHVGSGNIRAFVKDLTNGDHTDRRPVHHYVLMLQEAVRTDDVPPLADGAAGAARIPAHAPANPIDIVKIGSELGLSLIYVPSMRNGSSAGDPAEDRGSAILSTLPLSEPIAVELPGERQRRVVIIAKAGSTSVAVVHLDALGGNQRLADFLDSMDARRAGAVDGVSAARRPARRRRRSQHVARTRRVGGTISRATVSSNPALCRSAGARTASSRLHVLSRGPASARALPAGGTPIRIGPSTAGRLG